MDTTPINSEEVISELEEIREEFIEVSLYKQAKVVDIAINKLKNYDKLYKDIKQNNVTRIVQCDVQNKFVCSNCKGKDVTPILWILYCKPGQAILVDVDLMWDGKNKLICKKCGREINID